MSKYEFNFKIFSKDDIKHLDEIFFLCFGYKQSNEYFNWKYFQNPAGDVVAFTAWHNDKMAGFYGVIPELYFVDGAERIIYQSMDTMTHPEYQRLGLFTTLANKTYDYIVQEKSRINLIGFPGDKSLPGFVSKLKWKHVYDIPYVFTNKFLFNASVFFKKTDNNLLSVAELSKDDDYEEKYFSVKSNYKKSIRKLFTKKIIDWRIHDNPSSVYTTFEIKGQDDSPFGYAIIQKEKDSNRLYLVYADFLFDDGYSLGMNALIKYLFETFSPTFIYTFLPTNDLLLKAYNYCGFITNPFNRGYFSYKSPLILLKKNDDVTAWYDYHQFDIQPVIRDY